LQIRDKPKATLAETAFPQIPKQAKAECKRRLKLAISSSRSHSNSMKLPTTSWAAKAEQGRASRPTRNYRSKRRSCSSTICTDLDQIFTVEPDERAQLLVGSMHAALQGQPHGPHRGRTTHMRQSFCEKFLEVKRSPYLDMSTISSAPNTSSEHPLLIASLLALMGQALTLHQRTPRS
jgi:hypothetical protein